MIKLENITKEYGSKTLFRELNYQFPLGKRIALIGSNGTGKSTLLQIISAEIEADGGRVHVAADLRLGYLPQEPNPTPKDQILEECLTGAKHLSELRTRLTALLKEIEESSVETKIEEYSACEAKFRSAGGYSLEAKAQVLLAGLGFSEAMHTTNPLDLSGGWRMRLELVKVFMNDPDFLILDEPTNHLDLPSLVWVEDYLRSLDATLLFVSHDRALLNRLSEVSLELSRGKLTEYKGNFEKYLEQKQLRLEHDLAALTQIGKRKKDLQNFVDRFGAKASKAKQAQSKLKMLARLESEEEQFETEAREEIVAIRLPESAPSGRNVLTVGDGQIGYESLVLAKNIQMSIERSMKVAVIGANGIGKSTFLKSIVGKIPSLGGDFSRGHNVSLSYFAQDQLDTLDEEASVLDNILRAEQNVGQAEARGLLGNFLFHGDDVYKPVRVLSGGEKSRVGLAAALIKKANFLVLDEPTNHLDMGSVEVLAEALQSYSGTMIFVSHDRTFIDQICSHVFVMLADGRNEIFEGKLDDYQRLAKLSHFPNVLESADLNPKSTKKEKKPRPDSASKEQQKKVRKLERELAKLEQKIQQLKQEKQRINQELIDTSPTDFARLSELQTALEKCELEISNNEETWLDSSVKLEESQNP